MDSLKLLPCPFCGAKAISECDEYDWEFISCTNKECEAMIGSPDSAEDAAKKWNTRVKSPSKGKIIKKID